MLYRFKNWAVLEFWLLLNVGVVLADVWLWRHL